MINETPDTAAQDDAEFRAVLEGYRAQHTPEERYSLGLIADAVEFGYADDETRERYLARLKDFR